MPAWKHLISRSFPSHEVISLIQEIFVNEEEIGALDHLRGDDTQAFIDVAHEVRFHGFHPKSKVLLCLWDALSSVSSVLTRLWIPPVSYHGSGGSV